MSAAELVEGRHRAKQFASFRARVRQRGPLLFQGPLPAYEGVALGLQRRPAYRIGTQDRLGQPAERLAGVVQLCFDLLQSRSMRGRGIGGDGPAVVRLQSANVRVGPPQVADAGPLHEGRVGRPPGQLPVEPAAKPGEVELA